MSTTLDPSTFGRAAARATLRSIPGGGQSTLLRDRSHVYVHPPQPPTVEMGPFDREHDPDTRPLLPPGLADALTVLTHAVAAPGVVPRPEQVAAALVVREWAGLDRNDDAPAHGYPRPL